MTKETIISGVVGLILGILIALVFVSVTPWGGRMMYRNQMMGQIDDHFIDQMKQWYKSWFGNEVPNINTSMGHSRGTMMHGGMMGNETDIKTLENAKPFDKEFIEQMIPHHQMAVMMAQMLSRSTSRSEMKQLAENIISAQTI